MDGQGRGKKEVTGGSWRERKFEGRERDGVWGEGAGGEMHKEMKEGGRGREGRETKGEGEGGEMEREMKDGGRGRECSEMKGG